MNRVFWTCFIARSTPHTIFADNFMRFFAFAFNSIKLTCFFAQCATNAFLIFNKCDFTLAIIETDASCRAPFCTHATVLAFRMINFWQIADHFNRIKTTCFYTHATANTALGTSTVTNLGVQGVDWAITDVHLSH